MGKIVGKFNEELNEIHFYKILLDYKQYTILEKLADEPILYYIYNNKTNRLGKIHVIKLPKQEVLVSEIIEKDNIQWLTEEQLFFWGDSKFVTQFGYENYERLIEVYKYLLEIRKENRKVELVWNELKTSNVIEYLLALISYKNHKRKENKLIRRLKKELQLIW